MVLRQWQAGYRQSGWQRAQKGHSRRAGHHHAFKLPGGPARLWRNQAFLHKKRQISPLRQGQNQPLCDFCGGHAGFAKQAGQAWLHIAFRHCHGQHDTAFFQRPCGKRATSQPPRFREQGKNLSRH